MEKVQESRKSQNPIKNSNRKILVWDCGSSLYDSFELKSFERQLYSAIHSRTLSMPHLPDRKLPLLVPSEAETKAAAAPPLPPLLPPSVSKKPSSKISRSLHKFFKSVFKSNNSKSSFKDRIKGDQYYVVYDKSGALSTIPEVPEIDFGGFLPSEINSFVRKSNSERFRQPLRPLP